MHQIYLVQKLKIQVQKIFIFSDEEEEDDLEIPAFLRRQKN